MNRHNDHSANFNEPENAPGSGDRGAAARRRSSTTRPAGANPMSGSDKPAFTVDAGSILRPALRRWYWVVLGGIVGAGIGAAAGMAWWKLEYSANAQLVYIEPPVASDAYRPPKLNAQTLIGMIRSDEILSQAGAKMNPPMPGGALRGRVNVSIERQSEIVNISTRGSDPRSAVQLANHFNEAVVSYMQKQQKEDANQADGYTNQLLKETEADLVRARKTLPESVASTVTAPTAAPLPVNGKKLERIRAAEDELARLLVTFTDIHPKVRSQREVIARLRAEVPAGTDLDQVLEKAAAAETATGGMSREQLELAVTNVRTYDALRSQIIARQRAIQVFRENPPGSFRILQSAREDNVTIHEPWMKIGVLAGFLGLVGFMLATLDVLRRELFDNRLKTESDVTRVTGLPVLGTLGNINQMSDADRDNWAFRAWIALQDRLAFSPNHGLICGVTSSNYGDGRTTWINQLAGAARKCGFRVLTIATRSASEMPNFMDDSASASEPVVVGSAVNGDTIHVRATANSSQSANSSNDHDLADAESGTATATVEVEPVAHARMNGSANGATSSFLSTPSDVAKGRGFSSDSQFTALTASALFTPAMVTEKLMGPETDPLVHIPLPGWTWNLERRKQWQGALNVWRKIDNVVILVELPPASMPESVLLASNLPNLVWLVESGKSDAASTRMQLQTLRHARCNLVGTFINRALAPVTGGKLSRWVGCFALFGALALGGHGLVPSAQAQATQVSPEAATGAFSVVSPKQRAGWQEKLTLGPGDVLTFSLYGEERELTRKDVPVGPDGRVSYLEAHNIMAAGLTVDEFREKLNEELGKFRRAAQAYVVPVSYKSKKYFVLGKVAQRGAFPLDRPTTLIEAVARAGGLESTLTQDRGLLELADLSRSFISRNNQKLQVDFERLFREGDLSQNVALEPNDYIFIPGNDIKEVYVLGAVMHPGVYNFQTSTGAIGAIAARGGFTDRAWKKKLLVIRGSFGRPETFVLDGTELLTGQKSDLRLQPKDIVFVSERPWIRAEELLDAAASAFVTSTVVAWTTINVNP